MYTYIYTVWEFCQLQNDILEPLQKLVCVVSGLRVLVWGPETIYAEAHPMPIPEINRPVISSTVKSV